MLRDGGNETVFRDGRKESKLKQKYKEMNDKINEFKDYIKKKSKSMEENKEKIENENIERLIKLFNNLLLFLPDSHDKCKFFEILSEMKNKSDLERMTRFNRLVNLIEYFPVFENKPELIKY